MTGRLEHIGALLSVARGEPDSLEREVIEGLDLGAEYEDGELQYGLELAEAAEVQIHEMPLGGDVTTCFEIVFGTGGPDDRLVVECDTVPNPRLARPDYEIRRILYRYSWNGSAERRVIGGDREVAEELARRIVPELE